MQQRTPVNSSRVPTPVGPYSQAVCTGSFLFTSGIIPIDLQTGAISEGSIEDHAHLVFRYLRMLAEDAGTHLDKAVKVTIFLTDIAHFQQVNAVYTQYFSEPYPARSALQVAALPKGAMIEVEAVISL
ncbi:MAG: RidA family protein [Desulfobulbus sp.]|nr:RidA family protein [Desulfobulbus sp.]